MAEKMIAHVIGLDDDVRIPLRSNLERSARDLLTLMLDSMTEFVNEGNEENDGRRLMELVIVLKQSIVLLDSISTENIVKYVNGALFSVEGVDPKEVFKLYDQWDENRKAATEDDSAPEKR